MITIQSFKTTGPHAVPVTIECEIFNSGIGIHLVGLADQAVKESLLRTITALQAIGYRIPGKKIVINITPTDLLKENTGYDLPIAVAFLAASGQVDATDLDKYLFAGELGRKGTLRDIPGYVQAAELAAQKGLSAILPTRCAKLAARALQGNATIYGADDLSEVINILTQGAPAHTALDELMDDEDLDAEEYLAEKKKWWDSIKGNEGAKRALEIAAAGGHPLLLMGAPGSQKAELARALLDILPPMDMEQALEVQRIWSAADRPIIPGQRPFRAPHVATSLPALLGGGAGIRPGEVSLAHGGVLYVEHFCDMPKNSREALRGPLEDKKITISRLKSKVDIPADFFPVFSTPPCPCGYYGEGDRCTCTPAQRQAFLARLSGPLYDRLTIQVWTHPNTGDTASGEKAAEVAARVAKAREIQIARQGKLNDDLDRQEIDNVTSIGGNSREIKKLIEKLTIMMNLNAISYFRILKIARTIADLDGRDELVPSDIVEATSFRFMDRRDALGENHTSQTTCKHNSRRSSIPAAAAE